MYYDLMNNGWMDTCSCKGTSLRTAWDFCLGYRGRALWMDSVPVWSWMVVGHETSLWSKKEATMKHPNRMNPHSSAAKCLIRRFFFTIKLPYFTGNDNWLRGLKALLSVHQYRGAEQRVQSKRSPQISIIAKSILMNQCGRNSMIVNDFPPRTVTISPWISASRSHIRRHIMADATGSTELKPDKSPRRHWL